MGLFESVTELPGDLAPREQLERIIQRYNWAISFANKKSDILEIACGPGIGSDCINESSKSYIGIDIDKELVKIAKENNPKVEFKILNIESNNFFQDKKFDIIIIFEAIYYMNNIDDFFLTIDSLLKENGKLLICTANKNLVDFNKSEFSKNYYDTIDFSKIIKKRLLRITSVLGGCRIDKISFRQKILRPLKFLAAKFNLIPKNMSNKLLFKKIFYGGKLVKIPKKVIKNFEVLKDMDKLDIKNKNNIHKVLYFVIERIN
jgi:SAM-dependent methyltransferase